MNFIRWWTAALALMGATLTLCLGVVCLQYFFYMDLEPRLRQEWPTLLISTGLFAGLAVVGILAFLALHRQSRWLWPMQGVLLMTAATFGVVFWRMLTV